jgi:integrase
MAKLSDIEIRSWIKSKEHFDMRGDGDGLYLCYRSDYTTPVWRFRYRFVGKPRIMNIGSYLNLSLADARKMAKGLRVRVAIGYDVAGEKQERKREAIAEIEAKKNAYTMAQLADEFFQNRVLGNWKHPNIVRARIEKDIKPTIGHLAVEAVTPRHIDDLLKSIVKRGSPTMANNVLRWLKRIFNQAIKMHIITNNPASAFDVGDAGGKEQSRKRNLSRDEIKKLFAAMRTAKGFSIENDISIKLLLALAVRKGELIGARWCEFDLDEGLWHLPEARTKTSTAITIPLSNIVVNWFKELKHLSCGNDYVLPARKMQDRMIPHIAESTLGVALAKVAHGLEPFTIHDMRRTAKTLLASLGVQPHISERCLNHKINGVEGIYDGYDYFDERKRALNALSDLLVQLENGATDKVIPIKRKITVTV